MWKVGDAITIGPLKGEIVEVYNKTQIGFKAKNVVTYDIMFKGVPEEQIKPKEDGTDRRNTELSKGKKAKSD